MTQARLFFIVSLLFPLVFTGSASRQSELALRRFFEGKQIVVKMDMPGDKSGVDVHPDTTQPVDYNEVGDRLREYGVALYRGDSATVTLVKVKGKNIEFQLGGGGARDSGAPYISTYVPKSNRERRLEDAVRNETDPARKRELQDDLDDERDRRRREENRLRREAEQSRELARVNERERRAQGGSRFNIWYENGVPPYALLPEAVMHALGEYVDFPTPSDANSPASLQLSDTPNPLELRKGMTEREVNARFGEPDSRSVDQAGGVEITACEYVLDRATLSVRFAGGVLVHYVLTSR